MFLLIWLCPVKYPFKNNLGQAQQRLVSLQCIHNDESLLACLCLTVSQLFFSYSALIEIECITQQAPHDYFNKS